MVLHQHIDRHISGKEYKSIKESKIEENLDYNEGGILNWLLRQMGKSIILTCVSHQNNFQVYQRFR